MAARPLAYEGESFPVLSPKEIHLPYAVGIKSRTLFERQIHQKQGD